MTAAAGSGHFPERKQAMAKPIMIQGTMSNAGKSLLAAGLCRIFRQDGYKVAPFKSQNMALNSFITADGKEMGRAQVVQAEAAKIPPDVRMNPILLKPTSDRGSQVIVNGEVRGNMPAADYFRYKKELIPDILSAYESLAAENDIIVIEGAGSPAEINLKENDIVNMGLAKLVNAPVLLTGDIDRGGVFAALYGTVMLLTEEERRYIKATIINKFRGDVEILRPGLQMLYDLIGIPEAGVVPYLYLDIDDEDSLSEKLEKVEAKGEIDIAVIRLPRISNFTDFDPLNQITGAAVRYVSSAEELKNPDLVILPGTKNTMSDLKWLRQSGLEARIMQLCHKGTPVFGVCGGFQMLTDLISDPEGAENGGEMAGMGLLPGKTIFRTEKTRTRVDGIFGQTDGFFAPLSGKRFSGYEIHMGETEGETKPLTTLISLDGNQKVDGMQKGNVCGSYVHGIFDSGEVLDALGEALYAAKGKSYQKGQVFDRAAYKERQYDLLADALRQSLDMKLIYRILEEGV